MEYQCLYPSCDSSEGVLTVYPFPKDPKVRSKWVESIPGLSKRPNSTSGICSKHFLIKDFDEKENLRCGSLPFDSKEETPPLEDISGRISSLSDLADELEAHPEAIPPHIQHLTSPSDYTFYKIRFSCKKAPVVDFSLMIYSDLSFDVSHLNATMRGRRNQTPLELKSLQGIRTFRSIEEVQNVLQELDDLPIQEDSTTNARTQQQEESIQCLTELLEGANSAEKFKIEFLIEQIRLLQSSFPKKSVFSRKSMTAFKRLTSSQIIAFGQLLTLPDMESLDDEVKEFCLDFVENAEFLQNEEFKSNIFNRIAFEKDYCVQDVLSKTLDKLWTCNIGDFPSDIYTVVLLLLNDIWGFYNLELSQLGKIVDIREESSESDFSMIDEEDARIEKELTAMQMDEDFVMSENEGSNDENQDEALDNSGDPENNDGSCQNIIKLDFKCTFCPKTAQSLSKFLNHCKVDHGGYDVVLRLSPGPVVMINKNLSEMTCVTCKNSYFSHPEMRKHIKYHSQVRPRPTRAVIKSDLVNICGICDEECLDKTRLRVHYVSEHSTYSIFECKSCPEVFYKCSEYIKHKLNAHKKSLVANNPEKLYECEMCDQKFRFKLYLDKHYASEHEARKFPCDTCGRVFDAQVYLYKHKARVHPTSLDFVCEFCGKKFATNEYLSSHKKICKYRRSDFDIEEEETATREKNLKCEKCYRRFAKQVNLDNHMVVIHENGGSFQCSICNKHMSSLHNLNIHMALHDANRPKLPCPMCGKEYLNKTSLQFHITTIHEKDKNEKKFKCNQCNWSFWEKKVLKNHIKVVHNKIYDFKCDICERAFGTREHLSRHKTTIHDKFREYKCHLCSVEYFQRPSLKNHLKKAHDITDYMPPKAAREGES